MTGLSNLMLLERLKISCFARGIKLDPMAARVLSGDGSLPLTLHEYATTGGITFEYGPGVYVNAPFDEPFCTDPVATLRVDPASGTFFILFEHGEIPVRMLPLPSYLNERDEAGRLVTDVAMSHADRIRLSSVSGCVYDCKFCDIPGARYARRPVDQILAALRVAERDAALPPRHILMSGGSVGRRDYDYFDGICCAVARTSTLPVDVMMSSRGDDLTYIDRLVEGGVSGFAINLEIFDDVVASEVLPQKFRHTRKDFFRTIERAVEITEGAGRVRSLVIVGLESLVSTLQAVEELARRGCDPVLSPFRPARDTALWNAPAPSEELLARVYVEAREIAAAWGVELGPRCGPCQHNTLTFPSEVTAAAAVQV